MWEECFLCIINILCILSLVRSMRIQLVVNMFAFTVSRLFDF